MPVHLNHMLEGEIRGKVGGCLRTCGGEAQRNECWGVK